MGNLTIARKEGQRIFLSIDPNADPALTLKRLQEEGIAVCFSNLRGSQAMLTITAPREIRILREELVT